MWKLLGAAKFYRDTERERERERERSPFYKYVIIHLCRAFIRVHNSCLFFTHIFNNIDHCHGVVGSVPAFKPGGPGIIPGGVRDFNVYPGAEFVSFVFSPVLSLAEALIFC